MRGKEKTDDNQLCITAIKVTNLCPVCTVHEENNYNNTEVFSLTADACQQMTSLSAVRLHSPHSLPAEHFAHR